MQPLQNPLLWVSCPQAARLRSPRKLDVKCAFGPSNHITELNHRQETASDIQKEYIWQYCYEAYYSAKQIIELLLGTLSWLKQFGLWQRRVFIIAPLAASYTLDMNALFWLHDTHIMCQKRCKWDTILPEQATRTVTSDTTRVNITDQTTWTHNSN